MAALYPLSRFLIALSWPLLEALKMKGASQFAAANPTPQTVLYISPLVLKD